MTERYFTDPELFNDIEVILDDYDLTHDKKVATLEEVISYLQWVEEGHREKEARRQKLTLIDGGTST